MLCPPEQQVPPQCRAPIENEAVDRLCDGFDNDCDGKIDEGCICKPGEVQPCFLGPPGRVNTGACRSGTQRCVTENGRKVWGTCDGAIGPTEEVCDALDNDCNGCTDELFGCDPDGRCPAPCDPRILRRLLSDYPLNGEFYEGDAQAWSWTIEGGP